MRRSSIAAAPACGSARVDNTSKPVGPRRSTVASQPAPRSQISRNPPTGTCTPMASRRVAAATGASTSRGCPSPAACATCRSHMRRRGPHPAGTTIRTSPGGPPSRATATPATCRNVAAASSATGTGAPRTGTVPPSGPVRPASGDGTNPSGSVAACRHAASPTSTPPRSSRWTALHSTPAPSTGSGSHRPSGHPSTARVQVVP
jgi:hypothetical protein